MERAGVLLTIIRMLRLAFLPTRSCSTVVWQCNESAAVWAQNARVDLSTARQYGVMDKRDEPHNLATHDDTQRQC